MSALAADPVTDKVAPREVARLPRSECLALIRTNRVGRVAWFDRDGQRVHPVIYGYHPCGLEVRVDATDPLARLRASYRVVVEIDDLDPQTGVGWWVTVDGRTRPRGQYGFMIVIEQCRGSYWGPDGDSQAGRSGGLQ